MNNTIMYKGYIGSVEFSEEDCIFFGKVLGIRSLISYEGENAKELLDDFHGAVDDYLDVCKSEGKEPEVAFKGVLIFVSHLNFTRKSLYMQQVIRYL